MRKAPNRLWIGIGLIVVLVASAVILGLTVGSRPTVASQTTTTTTAIASSAANVGAEQVVAVPSVDATGLPEATTFGKLTAPVDTSTEDTDGTVAHPTSELVVFAAPGNTAFARLPVKELGNPTWVPVVGRQTGWVQVLLPSKPNGAVGWIDASHIQLAKTPYLIRVRLSTMKLTVFKDTTQVGAWTVAIGAPGTPTPTGRTFLLASISDPSQNYSPVILPLGMHSATLDSYGGGPGTVAIHTWPDKTVYGTAVSHGCVRIPADGLRQIEQIPLGTLVIITP